MGEAAIPLILERLQSWAGEWFSPLEEITGINPVNPDDYGNVPAMTESWLEWGRLNGYV